MSRIRAGAVAALVILSIVAVEVTTAGAQPSGPAVSVDPSRPVQGATVHVTGSGFTGDCGVLLYWGRRDGLVLGGAPVAPDGTFAADVAVPADSRPGANQIEARGRVHGRDGCAEDSGKVATAQVTVSPSGTERVPPIALLQRTIRTQGVDRAVIARARAAGRPVHAIVQLRSLPAPSDVSALASLGVRPLAYLNAVGGPGTAYLASIAPDVADRSARFNALIRGVHALLAIDKIDLGLAAQLDGEDPIDTLVLFFVDVSAEEAASTLARHGVAAVRLGQSSLYRAMLTPAQVRAIADEDAVQYLQAQPEEGQYDLDNSRTLSNADVVHQFDVPSATYLGLSGFGVQLSIHDSGVDDHHGDFANRMIRTLHPGAGGDHGTHVASIAAGSGAMSSQNADDNTPNGGTAFQWRGFAPQAGISAFGSQTAHDAGTMQTAIVTDGVDVSNHSYSYNDGQYDVTMVGIDTIIRGDSPGIPARPVVFSAGNQGQAPQFGQNSGYFSLSKSCKNCIMVANLQDGGALNGGSSHGPTPDGRLKPDLGANGSGVIAAGADVSDGSGGSSVGNSYRSKGGTSMATPAVTGIIALLLQQYAQQFAVDLDSNPPLPSTMKAILVQTAVDQVGTASGTNPDTGAATVYGAGPDWGTGYGSADAGAASELMAAERFLEDEVSEANVTDEHLVGVAAGQAELRVTIAWDDLPGTPNADDSAPQLVNDLDLLLVGPNGEVVRPLVMPPAVQFDCDGDATNGIQTGTCSPGADPGPFNTVAAPGTDRLNNVEQVVVANPAPGLWRARVSVLNNDSSIRLPLGGTQPYSIAGVGAARADLSIAKFDSPDPVMAGQELIYTVVVTNKGPDAAEGVVVVDTLPPEVIYLSDDAGCVYSAAQHELTCDLGDLANGASTSFRVKTMVRSNTVVNEADGTTNIVNTVTVSSTTADPIQANNATTEITFVQDLADLTVTKICKPDDELLAGQTATCTIFVDNLGPSDARSVVLRDTHLSDGAFSFGAITTSQGTCAVAADVVTCNLGDLAAASPSVSGRATVSIELSATEDVDINNVADVRSDTPDPNTANNHATEHVSVMAVSDLSITKTGPAAAIAGTDVTYDLLITNHGPSTATGVVVEDVVPLGVAILSVVASNGAGCNAGQPGNPLAPTTCSFGTLAPGDVRTMTIDVRVLPGTLGVLHNDARVSSQVFDDDLADNLATVTTTVTGLADLSITKADSPDPVIAGNPLTYTITVHNAGPSTAYDVKITDTLPDGTSFVSGEDGNGATVCTLVQPGTVVCDLGAMPPGTSKVVYLTVDVDPSLDPGAVLINAATVSSSTDDPDHANNTATSETTVQTQAELWIDKQAELRSGNPSNLVVYTLVVHNDAGCETDAQSTPTPNCGEGGPSDARDIVVVDALPLDPKKLTVQYVSPQCQYDAASHTVTCTSSVVPAGQSVTFVIEAQVQGSVKTIANTATVSASTFDPVLANNTNEATIVHQGGTGGKGGGNNK
jgi:uncharacterized repeat protein (TIGR01451 family)